MEKEKKALEEALQRTASNRELVLYLQHPRDAVDFFRFEEEYGKTYVLPPSVWLKEGGFGPQEAVSFTDHTGKVHQVLFSASQTLNDGGRLTYLYVDHHLEPFYHEPEAGRDREAKKELTPKEIADLAEMGEVRAPMAGVVTQVLVKKGQKVAEGDSLLVVEAMKMLNSLNTPVAGVVAEVAAAEGQPIRQGDLLLRIRPPRAKD